MVWRIIAADGPVAEFHRLAYIAFLFAFRVPSEGFLLHLAHKGGRSLHPQGEKSIDGCRLIAGVDTLAANMAWRKNMPWDVLWKVLVSALVIPIESRSLSAPLVSALGKK